MSEEKILRRENKDNPEVLEISKNQEFIECAESLFNELKSYLHVEDRNLKDIWNMNNWPGAMAGLYQYIKAGMTDPNAVMRRGTLIQMMAYCVVCYRTLSRDPKEVKDAQARITQRSVEEGDKHDADKAAREEAARQALRKELLENA